MTKLEAAIRKIETEPAYGNYKDCNKFDIIINNCPFEFGMKCNADVLDGMFYGCLRSYDCEACWAEEYNM